MNPLSPAWWRRARRVRDQMVTHFGNHPVVTNIDIGFLNSSETSVIGVRIHVRGEPADLTVPAELDGIPIGIVPGDYRIQSGVGSDPIGEGDNV